MSEDKPFEAGYAKSNRSTCKGCLRTISADSLRLAVIRRSFHFDGKVTSWFHERCFWSKHRPKSVADIDKFKSLKKPDQDKIALKIQGCSELPEPEVPKKGQKGKKGKKTKAGPPPTFMINDFTVQYAKSNRAQCGGCPAKIAKGEIRVAKKDYESDKAKMFGGFDQWHHLNCFVQLRNKLEFTESGSRLPGFNTLSPADQQIVSTSLPSLSGQDNGPTPAKKAKVKSETSETKVKVEPDSEERAVLDDISDQAQLSTNEPKSRGRGRAKKSTPVPSSSSSDQLASDGETVIRFLPLKDMTFFIHSSENNRDVRQDLTRQIIMLGGSVVSKLNPNVTAVIATKKALDNFSFEQDGPLSKANLVMDEIHNLGIHVVTKAFLKDAASETGNAIDKILSRNQAFWASDDRYDIEQRMKNYQVEVTEKSNSKSILKSQHVGSKLKIQVQDGVAVDPESNLADVTEVAKRKKKPLNAVFSLADAVTGKNSYYKIQVLQSKVAKSKFYLFRSWGRIGTTIGGTKVEEFKSLKNAFEAFDKLFLKESGNYFDEPYVQVPGKMVLMDVNYEVNGQSDGSEDKVDGPSSEDKSEDFGGLEERVIALVKFLFNQEQMRSVLREFELDIEKMPLGKISLTQIKQGFSILEQTLAVLLSDNKSKVRENQILALTNTFYTLIPHSFGLKSPPLFETVEMITTKLDLLETMIQIDEAYKMTRGITTNPVLSYYKKLQSDIKPIDTSHDHFDVIMKYIRNTHAQTHRQYELKVMNIFEVTRLGESKRFKPFSKMANKTLLWHGSRQTNFASIISKGLCIAPPEAPVTGYMFGKGIYFADSVSKSANYCMTTSTNNVGLLLLCEVALGTMYERMQADFITKLPSGYHSVKGVGRSAPDPNESSKIEDIHVPLGPLKETSVVGSLLYNEFIVYDPAQVRIRYLIQTEFDYNYSG